MKMINQIVEELKRLKGVDVVLEAPVNSPESLHPCAISTNAFDKVSYEQAIFKDAWVDITVDFSEGRVYFGLPINSENIPFPKIEDVKSAVNKIINTYQKQKLDREAELEKEIEFLEEKLSILKGEKESLA